MRVEDVPTPLRQELASVLEAERERLQRSTRSLAEAERTMAESQASEGVAGGGSADVATDLAEEELDLTLFRGERSRLDEVEAALRRLAGGTYGRCQACGEAIAVDRLRVLPWTRRCLGCAAASVAGMRGST